MNSKSGGSDSSNDSMANPLHILHQQHPQQQPQPQERYVWEMRTRSPNVTPASTVLNSPDLNADLPYAPLPGRPSPTGGVGRLDSSQDSSNSYYYQRPHLHQIRVGRSPGSSQFETQDRASPGSPTDVGKADGQCLRDGEIVVFDDIDTNWMNNKAASGQHPGTNEDVLKVTKMIGQLPIAEYEGSPRRFGSQPPAGQRKRPPGFPQRVSPTTSSGGSVATPAAATASASMAKASVGNLIDLIDHEDERSSTTATTTMREKAPTFDYLYEFSETRKVLEEFFKANPEDEKRFTDYTTESGDDVASSVSETVSLVFKA